MHYKKPSEWHLKIAWIKYPLGMCCAWRRACSPSLRYINAISIGKSKGSGNRIPLLQISQGLNSSQTCCVLWSVCCALTKVPF